MVLNLISLILLGLIFGSLGSVIFFRLGDLPNWKTLKGFLFWRSKCTHCHHTLHAQDLIPLRSFFSQGGKCRYCKAKLSRRYPTLEIWTVLIFLSTRFFFGMGDHLARVSQAAIPTLWLRLLFIIALYDLKEYELHLTASIFLLLLSFLWQRGLGYDLFSALQGMLIFFLLFLCIYFGARGYLRIRYKKKAEGFGFGDVILAGILGSIFPVFLQVSGGVEWMFFLSTYMTTSCLIGILLYGILSLLPSNKKSPSSHNKKTTSPMIPFIPAMSVAFLLFLFCGDTLLSFLLHF